MNMDAANELFYDLIALQHIFSTCVFYALNYCFLFKWQPQRQLRTIMMVCIFRKKNNMTNGKYVE